MQIRLFDESDGKCFAKMRNGCSALKGQHPMCGTYRCCFYKPDGCADWIRLDTRNMVRLFMPEDVGRKYAEDRFEEKIEN